MEKGVKNPANEKGVSPEWCGPIAALSQMKNWDTTEPGSLALGTYNGGWAVS